MRKDFAYALTVLGIAFIVLVFSLVNGERAKKEARDLVVHDTVYVDPQVNSIYCGLLVETGHGALVGGAWRVHTDHGMHIEMHKPFSNLCRRGDSVFVVERKGETFLRFGAFSNLHRVKQ